MQRDRNQCILTLVNEQTLVYGTFGIAHGDYDYSFAEDGFETTENFSTTGVAAGFGVERMMNENMSVFAEYQYRDFGNELVIFEEWHEAGAIPALGRHRLGPWGEALAGWHARSRACFVV